VVAVVALLPVGLPVVAVRAVVLGRVLRQVPLVPPVKVMGAALVPLTLAVVAVVVLVRLVTPTALPTAATV
jgi:hypothetical protein